MWTVGYSKDEIHEEPLHPDDVSCAAAALGITVEQYLKSES